MYIEYEIETNMDLAEVVTNEFIHMTREEACDVILKITGDFFKYYDGGNKDE